MKKQFAYKLNTRGFLLVEHLIALIITSLLILTLLSCIQVTQLYASNTDAVLLNELEALNTQLQIESKLALSFSAPSPNIFRIQKRNGDLVTYFISDQRLMRQVNGKGGEVALYHCHELSVNIINDSSASLDLKTSSQSATLYLTTFNLPLPIIESLAEDELDLLFEELEETEYPEEEEEEDCDDEILLDPETDVSSPNQESDQETDVSSPNQESDQESDATSPNQESDQESDVSSPDQESDQESDATSPDQSTDVLPDQEMDFSSSVHEFQQDLFNQKLTILSKGVED